MSNNISKENPLLNFNALPRFTQIAPHHIEPALDYMLDVNRNQIENLASSDAPATWQNFMAPMEKLSDQLDKMWSPVAHLNGVKDSEDLRKAYEACLPKLTDYGSELGQNTQLFKKVAQIRNSIEYEKLDQPQRKAIDDELLDFRLSGIDLDTADRSRFKQINSELSEVCNQFSQNLLDATDAWTLHITDQQDLAGLPDNVVQQAKALAQSHSLSGWVFSLQAPSYMPFLTYAENRNLRERMYQAYVTRASDVGPNADQWDNSPLICKILRLRSEKAKLLGFEDYATYSVQTKMTESPVQIVDFLNQLAQHSKAGAAADLNELQSFARQQLEIDELQAWDFAWVSDKLKQFKFDISEETLRPYFPLSRVLKGMFEIVNRLFGIAIKEKDLIEKWDSSVQFFEVTDETGQLRGHFYTDLFARAHKRGGAWMADCVGRRMCHEGLQTPVAFLTCNFAQPVNGQPSLLSHNEVLTLFHEFGHGLHHMLTKIDVAAVSGINGVPWDAVELPSQFLENWCWEREALDMISGHYKSGEKISQALFDKMHAARNFQSAMQMLRQIEFSLFDLELHVKTAKVDDPDAVRSLLKGVRERVSVVETPSYNRFENSFGHIFAGGYAAGYYSYKWAEVLSADAFGLFEERGIFDADTGRSFLTHILEKGGSEEPMQLFTAFRGRKPEIKALLRHSGLSE